MDIKEIFPESKVKGIEVLEHTKYKVDYKFNTAKSLNLVQK